MIKEIYQKLDQINSRKEMRVNKDFWVIDGQDARRLHNDIIINYLDSHFIMFNEDTNSIYYFHFNKR